MYNHCYEVVFLLPEGIPDFSKRKKRGGEGRTKIMRRKGKGKKQLAKRIRKKQTIR